MGPVNCAVCLFIDKWEPAVTVVYGAAVCAADYLELMEGTIAGFSGLVARRVREAAAAESGT